MDTHQTDKKVWYLRHLDLFLSLTDEEIEEANRVLYDFHVPAGAELFHEGQREAIFLIKTGVVKLYARHERGQATLALLGRGRLFGLSSDFGDSQPMIGATTLEPSYICSATWPQLLHLFGQHPDVMLKMTQALVEQIFHAETWLQRVQANSPRARLAALLLDLSHDFGDRTEEGFRLRFPLMQVEIASMLNVTRETVSRVMREFYHSGWIGRDGKRLIIHNRAALREVLQGHDPS